MFAVIPDIYTAGRFAYQSITDTVWSGNFVSQIGCAGSNSTVGSAFGSQQGGGAILMYVLGNVVNFMGASTFSNNSASLIGQGGLRNALK